MKEGKEQRWGAVALIIIFPSRPAEASRQFVDANTEKAKLRGKEVTKFDRNIYGSIFYLLLFEQLGHGQTLFRSLLSTRGEVITITFTQKSISKILHNQLLTCLFYLVCICKVPVSILYFLYHVALDVSYDVVCISQLLHPVLKVFLSREFIRHFKEDTELSFKKIYTETILSLNNKTLFCSAFNSYSNYIVIFNYIADLGQNYLKIRIYIENVK